MNSKIEIFKQEPGFIKLFKLFKDKYRSLGKIGGSVKLNTFNQKELESISGFLGQPYETLSKKGSLALATFERELKATGFSDYTLFSLIEAVLEETITTKKEELEREQQLESEFLQSLRQALPQADGWLNWIQSKSSDSRWIWVLYKQDKNALFNKMAMVYNAFSNLPNNGEFERLPFFSQRITGNPHAFDPNQELGRLLIHCMAVHLFINGQSETEIFRIPKGAEELNECLAEYGVLRDDLWNFVTCQGLLASKDETFHPVWEAAVASRSVLNMPMKELVKVDSIRPANGNKVWILENSSVASVVMEALPEAPIICTHGQFRLASWRLIDRLVEANCTLYYSGDLDPEGLLIADRLKRRYKDCVVIWRMDKETYQKSVSDEDLSDRLGKLDTILSPFWKDVIKQMRIIKKAGYQEAIVSTLIEDIDNCFDKNN